MGLDPAVEIPKIFGFIPICINVPAILLILVITILLIQGIKESTKAATILVFVKLFVILLLFIFAGAFYVSPENWVPFSPNGIKGVLSGAFLIFFAYVGVDAVSSAAEETKNPQRSLPIGIIGTLIVCTIVYTGTALVLSGMVPLDKINVLAPITAAMNSAGLYKIGVL